MIAAYARMETRARADTACSGVPSETPVEYLRRVLLGVTARGDAVESPDGQLFELAQFSRHEIDALDEA